jgi:hypothetical protein
MSVENPMLRSLGFLIPLNCTVGTGIGNRLLPFGLHRIDNHDSIVTLANRAVFCRTHAGGVIAVLTHYRQINDIHDRALAAFPGPDVDPTMTMTGHGSRIARKFIADVLILIRQRTQIAIRARGNIYNQVPFLHHQVLRLNDGLFM